MAEVTSARRDRRADRAVCLELACQVPPARLSPRQREIAALIAAGRTRVDIARELGLTPGTVGVYLQQIRWRLGVRRRDDIAAWAERHGLYRRPR